MRVVRRIAGQSGYGQSMTVMQRRSWYLPADVAERLAAVVDDIHFETRRPKHEVLGAAMSVAMDHQADIMTKLSEGAAK